MSYPSLVNTAWTARTVRACLTVATLVCAASSVHAQFNYLSQSRSIDASAHANSVIMEPVYSYYPYNPYNPQSGGQYISSYIPRIVGNSDSQSIQSAPDNFGDYSGTVQAVATYEDSIVTSTSTASSSLQADRIEMQFTGELAHQNQHSHPSNYPDHAGASMAIAFRLDAATTLAVERTDNFIVSEAPDNVKNMSWFKITQNGLSAGQWLSTDSGYTISLNAGDYLLNVQQDLVRNDEWGAGTLASTFVLRAVPEASTWAMMGLGLSGLALVARRRRPATPRVA